LVHGDRTKSTDFDGPDRHTISWADAAGSEVEILFEGKAPTYTYTKAPNRGIAPVAIDGVDQGTVGPYSSTENERGGSSAGEIGEERIENAAESGMVRNRSALSYIFRSQSPKGGPRAVQFEGSGPEKRDSR
jgi:hypothetical protein